MTDFHALSAEEIRAHRETVLLRLMIRVSQIETATLVAQLHQRGHGTVQRAHITVLGNIDTEGTRLVELARRLGTSRQAVSQLVREIESRGFLERTPDPEDGRATRVRHTADGKRLLADALELMDRIETGYAELVGADDLDHAKRVLRTIADTIDARTAL